MYKAALLIAVVLFVWFEATGQGLTPTKVHVNGVDLTYIESGRGEPLILLHGGQGDYRSWAPQMAEFSTRYRVISYSRRFHYPNQNVNDEKYRFGYSDAEDLAALIHYLKLGRVHLVGVSAGAFTALVLAIKHPEMVRSMVLAEPPVHSWAKGDPAGGPLYNAFMENIWAPAGAEFGRGNETAAMRVLTDGLVGAGTFDGLPPAAREMSLQNSRFFKVATASDHPFPDVPKRKVAQLKMPVLIVTGENTISLHKFDNDELGRTLPNAQRVTIPKAGHGSPRDNPVAFNAAVSAFLDGPKKR